MWINIWMVYFKGFHRCCFIVLYNHFVVLFQKHYKGLLESMIMWWYEICVSSGITLVALLVPISLGMGVKRKWPNAAKKILKVGILHILHGLFNENSWTGF